MNLIILFGPPAVGKMTVGQEVQKLTDYRVFHNHMTIDLVTPFFDFGTPPFSRLVGSFRKQILIEIAESDLPGVIFTFVWALDEPKDTDFVGELREIFTSRGGKVYFVELDSDLETRLKRNKTENRLLHKPSKRNLDWSEKNLVSLEDTYTMNSEGEIPFDDPFLKIKNAELSAQEAAIQIKDFFGLPAKLPAN